MATIDTVFPENRDVMSEALLRDMWREGHGGRDFIFSGFGVTDGGGLNAVVATGEAYIEGTKVDRNVATSLVMTNNATNYIFLYFREDLNDDTVYFEVNTTGTPPSYPNILLATVVTSGGSISTINDKRNLFPLKDDTVGSSQIADDAVGSAQIQDSAIITARIADDAVTGLKIADDSIGSEHIEPDAVGSAQIQDNAIITARISDGAVTGPKIATGAVGSTAIGPDAVGASEIAANAVGASELGPDAVGSEHIEPDAVGSAQIQDSAIITTRIADGAVTGPKLAVDSVGSTAIKTSAVGSPEIAPNAVGRSELIPGLVTTVFGSRLDLGFAIPGGSDERFFLQPDSGYTSVLPGLFRSALDTDPSSGYIKYVAYFNDNTQRMLGSTQTLGTVEFNTEAILEHLRGQPDRYITKVSCYAVVPTTGTISGPAWMYGWQM